jgi:hypothetical protein
VPGQAVDHDVQERAEDRAEDSGERDCLHRGLIDRCGLALEPRDIKEAARRPPLLAHLAIDLEQLAQDQIATTSWW